MSKTGDSRALITASLDSVQHWVEATGQQAVGIVLVNR